MLRLLIILLFFSSRLATAQNADSLVLLSNKIPVDTNNLEALLKLSKKFQNSKIELSMQYAEKGYVLSDSLDNATYRIEFLFNKATHTDEIEEQYRLLKEALQIAEENKFSKHILRCKYKLARYYENQNKKDTALSLYNEILDSQTIGEPENAVVKATIYYKLGLSCKREGKFHESKDYFLQSFEIISNADPKLENTQNVKFAITSGLGSLMSSLKDYKSAIKYQRKCLQMMGTTTDNRVAVVHNNMGNAFSAMGKKDSAIVHYDIALNSNPTKRSKSFSYQGLGVVATNEKRYDNAIENFTKALEIAKSLGYKPQIANFQSLLGQAYFEKGDLNKAHYYLKKSEPHILATGNAKLIRDLERNLMSIKMRQGLPIQYERFKYFVESGDSLYNENMTRSIHDAITKYETEKKEAENALLRNEKELQAKTISQQRYTVMGTVGGLGFLGIISFLLFRQSSERKRKNFLLKDQRDQIDALHKDLAHRVKNNLYFVSTLMKMQANRMKSSEAKEAILEGESRVEAMSLLHRKLNMNIDGNDILLSDYIREICENLEHSYPFEGKRPKINFLSDMIKVDAEIAMRIGLIVNELVTNSFKHAFANVNSPIIDIEILSKGSDKYSIVYKDNGSGLPSNIEIEKSDSMGLKLIHTLTKQLRGKINIPTVEHGTTIQFEFNSKSAA